MNIRALASALSLALVMAGPGVVRAAGDDHDHGGHSDIEIGKEGNRIKLYGGETAANGHKVYEGEFTFPDYQTDDPGFKHHDDPVPGLNGPIVISGLGPLLVFGGDGWTTAPDHLSLVMRKEFSRFRNWEIMFDKNGVTPSSETNGAPVTIGEIGLVANGELHEHIDFFLDGEPTKFDDHSAYAIKVMLSHGTQGYKSDAFYIAFNNGMDHEAFETAIAATAAPETYALMGAGLVMLAGVARRRKASQKA